MVLHMVATNLETMSVSRRETGRLHMWVMSSMTSLVTCTIIITTVCIYPVVTPARGRLRRTAGTGPRPWSDPPAQQSSSPSGSATFTLYLQHLYSIYTVSAEYLHNINKVPAQYLHRIYIVSTEYLQSIFLISIKYLPSI